MAQEIQCGGGLRDSKTKCSEEMCCEAMDEIVRKRKEGKGWRWEDSTKNGP